MILIFSGTRDGREIVTQILEKGYEVIVSTATKYGADLICDHPKLKKTYGELSSKDIADLIDKEQVTLVIDVTHPYAVEISKNILLATEKMNTRCLRYERPSNDYAGIIKLNSFDEIIQYLNKTTGTILLTTGANNLKLITAKIDKKRLIARILPVIASLNKARAAGLKPAQIIAMQGPFSYELNAALLKSYGVKYIVTKDSGNEGGLQEKIDAAKQNNVEVIMLSRPKLEYKVVVESIEGLLYHLG